MADPFGYMHHGRQCQAAWCLTRLCTIQHAMAEQNDRGSSTHVTQFTSVCGWNSGANANLHQRSVSPKLCHGQKATSHCRSGCCATTQGQWLVMRSDAKNKKWSTDVFWASTRPAFESFRSSEPLWMDDQSSYCWVIHGQGGLFHRISGNVPSLRDRRLCRVWIIGIWLLQAVSMDCLRKIQALPTLSDFRGIRITGQSSDEAEAVGFRVDFFPEYSVAYGGRLFLSHFKIMFHIKKSLARVCLHLSYQLFGDVNPNICSSFKTIIPFLSFPMFEHQKDTGNRQPHLVDFG